MIEEWLETINGYVIATSEPTCKQNGRNTKGSILDYAVVSNWIVPVVNHIRVVDGPFKDFSGTVDTIDYEKSKLRVSVVIFGRATPVELEFGQIEKEI